MKSIAKKAFVLYAAGVVITMSELIGKKRRTRTLGVVKQESWANRKFDVTMYTIYAFIWPAALVYEVKEKTKTLDRPIRRATIAQEWPRLGPERL